MSKNQQFQQEEVKESVQKPFWKTTVAGGVGGACLVLVGHPLDTIKVKMQTMKVIPGQTPPYTSTLDCARKTIKLDGPRGLYRGMAAPLYGITPMYALCFFGYEVGKRIFTDEESYTKMKLFEIALAGATCGLFTTPILAPQERIKCVLQVQDKNNIKYHGTSDCAKGLYREGGLKSLNRGLCATMARDSIASAFYFSSYEYFKRLFTPKDAEGPSTVGTLMAGGIAGMFNWAFAIPIDTLKTRLQVAPEGTYPHGIRSVFKEVIAKEGASALFRGLGPIMIRAFPANAACFLGYETAMKVLNHF